MQISELQEMMRRIYYHQDSERGIEETYSWLVNEVKELGEALRVAGIKDQESEFADVIAWLASLANVANVNLQKAVLDKYNSKCPKCGRPRCRCGAHKL